MLYQAPFLWYTALLAAVSRLTLRNPDKKSVREPIILSPYITESGGVVSV
jgi:hypothetical protein